MRVLTFCAGALGLLLGAPTPGSANVWFPPDFPPTFLTNLVPLNGSGVSGFATVVHNEDLGLLSVQVFAEGLVPDRPHLQRLHGRFGPEGEAQASVTPPPEADADGDGFVEFAEGLPFYGAVILPLVEPDGAFPIAEGGTIDFFETYDLSDASIFAEGFAAADLFPLQLRGIVLYGGFVPPGVEDADPDADGPAYSSLIPLAAGELVEVQPGFVVPIPLPATSWTIVIGVAALAGLGRRSSW